MLARILATLALLLGYQGAMAAGAASAVELAIVPSGMQLQLYADEMPKARSLDVADDGTVAVGSNAKSVYLFRDENDDGVPDVRLTLTGLTNPNGVAWHGKDLFISETTRVLKATNVVERKLAGAEIDYDEVISGFYVRGLFFKNYHGRRFMAFGPDDKLYVAFGVPCNVCEPPDPEKTGTIRSFDVDTGTVQTYAYGLRNSVGFDWHPVTEELWITDNGRDWMGDDLPEDELNRAYQAGLHFGNPFCHQGDLPDPKFGKGRRCTEFEAPALKLGPHTAALGMHFLDADTALIALHGSWNRSEKIGYEVIQVGFDATGTGATHQGVFVGGWLRNERVIARPVDITSLADGSILVSDDFNGAVYRISKK